MRLGLRRARPDTALSEGIDAKFHLDGVCDASLLPAVLRDLRAALDKPQPWQPLQLAHEAGGAWFAGPRATLRAAVAAMRAPYAEVQGHLVQPPHGWWWPTDGGFAVFLEQADAQTWLECLRNPPKDRIG